MEMELNEESIGPNRIRPAEKYVTTDQNSAVKIFYKDYGTYFKPISIPGLLNDIVENYEDNIALVSNADSDGNCRTYTYREYKDQVTQFARVFIKLGLKERNSVGILGFNCPEWYIAKMAVIYAGGIAAGIYTTNSPEAVQHILEDSTANIVVVDDSKQMDKIRKIRKNLPHLKAAIQINGPFEDYIHTEEGYYTWNDLEKIDANEYEEELQNRLKKISLNECCLLIYTSGTVGMPKGVMLSHDNIIFASKLMIDKLQNYLEMGVEAIVSYLPLSHIAAQISDVYMSLLLAAAVHFAGRDALKGTLVNSLVKARPTVFIGVPRVYEKIEEKFKASEVKITGWRKYLMNAARSTLLQYQLDILDGYKYEGIQYKLMKYFVGNKIKATLGLDRCKIFCTGAAPISHETKRFFLSIDIKMFEIYGLSESSGPVCISVDDSPNLDTCGRIFKPTQVKIFEPDETGHGEVCAKGRNIFMGYLNNEQKTKEAIDDDGWFHSGDVGYIDNQGFIYITGRIKEIIITAGGENIPPVHIENLIKQELPFISYAFLVGERKKFLTLLVTLKTLLDPENGAPLDTITDETKEYFQSIGLEYNTLKEILDAGPCPIIMENIQKGIDIVNERAISNAQKIQKFAILPHDFSIPTGELGPTLKVNRNVVSKMYEDIIENFYK